MLYREISNLVDNGDTIVEVGSWKGRSISFLSVECINQSKFPKIYAVDTWEGSAEHKDYDVVKDKKLFDLFKNNIKPISHLVTPIRKKSTEAAKDFDDSSVKFIFIDAAHDYQSVKEDIAAWYPKVIKGGIIAGHDYYSPGTGVRQAVDEFFGSRVISRGVNENCWIVHC